MRPSKESNNAGGMKSPPTKLARIGVDDQFGESGPAVELLHKYKLDGEGVYEQVKAFLG